MSDALLRLKDKLAFLRRVMTQDTLELSQEETSGLYWILMVMEDDVEAAIADEYCHCVQTEMTPSGRCAECGRRWRP